MRFPCCLPKIAGSSSDYGRIDQCFAKSWKAKTLLLKASPQFNPKRMYDNAYWKEAYVAAKEAYDFCVQNGIALTENPADICCKKEVRRLSSRLFIQIRTVSLLGSMVRVRLL